MSSDSPKECTDEEKKMTAAQALIVKATEIIQSVPSAGHDSTLHSRIYQLIQAQEADDNAAFYKEMRCAIHLGLIGECSNPITLPCGHSFCKTCIAPLYFIGVTSLQRKCPQCRASITMSYDNLHTNVSLMGITSHLLPRGVSHDEASIAEIEARVVRYPYTGTTQSYPLTYSGTTQSYSGTTQSYTGTTQTYTGTVHSNLGIEHAYSVTTYH